jgi:hypothetical protein
MCYRGRSCCGMSGPAVLLQPLQLFTNLNFAVPGIPTQPMSFAGEDEQARGNAARVQGTLEQIILAAKATSRPRQGRGDCLRRYPWAAGTRTVPLPTATQFQPLRGSARQRRPVLQGLRSFSSVAPKGLGPTTGPTGPAPLVAARPRSGGRRLIPPLPRYRTPHRRFQCARR